ncbi:hypothetical protein [Thermoplasma volcanium GSS1]|uniref:Archaeal Type IV pilin N-terminal domain-containing protein n=1 Tax=Thermoplasma volcanium (strain ATCC 51530 / DSM 4299 / JCM 9571 / NBRC 15438 / GSS1) TaxID=273116 RepID=Q97AP6_THEVO|nr:archaellin/type IV pilin N-terminal domain-containing protein [Thermoplasma volcanium]BAB59906.1 hypothetical protein [Thermoplasma volcanium GSS1]
MEDKAVSPIIATILLIAITVALAATFYTEVTPYFTEAQYYTPQAVTDVMNVSNGSSFSYDIYIQFFPANLTASQVEISLHVGSSYEYINLKMLSPFGKTTLNNGSITISQYPSAGYFTQGLIFVINSTLPLHSIIFVDLKTSSSINTVSI